MNKCHNCGNDKFIIGKVEEVFIIDHKPYLIKNIPAHICTRCDERYFTPEVQKATMKTIEDKNRISTIEIGVFEYA